VKVTIGADPEFFIEDKYGNLRSAIDYIGGTKDRPRSLRRPGFAVLEDNVAVEFNIPPATSEQEFIKSIQWSKKEIKKLLDKMQFRFNTQAAVLFPAMELADPRTRTFGCEPDFNAWKMGQRNPKPHAKNQRLRSCGGHIHVGYSNALDISKINLVKLMDLYLGVPSVLMDEDVDRRELYGKAGTFRPTAYGVEYRTLSNFWIFDPQKIRWAYRETHRAIRQAATADNTYLRQLESSKIADCINTSNIDLALQLISEYDLCTV